MVNQKKGNIINISSAGGLSQGDRNAYGVSKAGIIKMTRALAWDLAKHNVRVNAIAPGWVKTDILQNVWSDHESLEEQAWLGYRWVGLARRVIMASAALFLASEASGYITGHTIVVDGGLIA